jgi:hypothetical protein
MKSKALVSLSGEGLMHRMSQHSGLRADVFGFCWL